MSFLSAALLLLPTLALAGEPVFPLESLDLQGSALPPETLVSLAGLKLAGPVNKAAIESACKKLEETGLFESIAYRYAPGPHHGFAVTITLADQTKLVDAAIDVPGVDEAPVWDWLAQRFPPFRRRVPGGEAAQQYLAHGIEQHLGSQMDGQPLVPKLEQDNIHHKFLISFRPGLLPRVVSMSFTGNHEFSEEELRKILAPVAANAEFTERLFREYVDLNLGRAYESHGMYRVRFPAITAQKTGPGSVAVTTAIEEGPQFTLGEVRIVGDGLPAQAILAAGKFRTGQIANWDEIQKGVWEGERPVKRSGYFEAAAKAERVFHDDRPVLDLNISFALGPLYHFGELLLQGLSSPAEQKARALWKPHPGDPYDFLYPGEFIRDLSRVLDLRAFKIASTTVDGGGAGHVKDIVFTFTPR